MHVGEGLAVHQRELGHELRHVSLIHALVHVVSLRALVVACVALAHVRQRNILPQRVYLQLVVLSLAAEVADKAAWTSQ